MKINQLHIVLYLLFLVCSQIGNAQIIEVPLDLKSQSIGKSITYWGDTNCDASIDFVFQNKDSLKFQLFEEDFFAYHEPNSCPWIYFQLVNPSDKNIQIQLRLDNHKLSKVEWHTYRKDVKINSEITGDNLSFSERPIQHLNYLFPIEMVANDTLDCYLFLYRGTNVIYSNIFIQTMDDYIGKSATANYMMGILIGISFFFVVIAFVILILFRTKLLFTYFLMVFFMFVFSIAIEGIGFQYIWGNDGKFTSRFAAIFSPIAQIIAFISFGILYFKTKHLHPKSHRLLLSLVTIIGVLIFVGIPIMLFFKDSIHYYKVITRVLIYLLEGVIISAFLIIFSVAVQEYQKTKDKEFLAFIMVVLVYLFFLGALFLQTFGVLWVNEFLEYSLLPSFIFEMMVLTLIIFRNYRKNLLEKERLEITYNQNQIKIVNALLEGGELERRRIASDLHDSLGSLLSISKLYLSQANLSNKEEVETWVEKAHTETRRLSNALMPKSLFTLGLVPAIQDLCGDFEKTKNVNVLLVKNDLVFPYSDFQKINFYRLVNELLSIAIIEFQAKTLTLQLTEFEEDLNLILEDNGNGELTEAFFEKEKYKNTLTRIEALKGEMHIDSTKGRGTNVVIDFQIEV